MSAPFKSLFSKIEEEGCRSYAGLMVAIDLGHIWKPWLINAKVLILAASPGEQGLQGCDWSITRTRNSSGIYFPIYLHGTIALHWNPYLYEQIKNISFVLLLLPFWVVGLV